MIGKPETSPNTLTEEALAWGRPPVPFLAGHLADAFGTEPLPAGLQRDLEIDGARPSVLARPGMDRWPTDDGALERIGDQVVALVHERLSEVIHLPVVGGPMPARPEVAIHTWLSGRPRNVLLRTGLAIRSDRLRSATFGELLEARNVGVRTALEVTALLETSALLDPESAEAAHLRADHEDRLVLTPLDRPVRWGEPPAPLLPEPLRRAFANEPLPEWLTRDLRLPSGATSLALDASIWKRIDHIPARAAQYLIGLLTYRREDIRDTPILKDGWTRSVRPEDLDWPTRLRNALTRTGLLHPDRLGTLTFGDLLAIQAVGVKSALDFAVIAEETTSTPTEALDDNAREALLQAEDEAWAERIRAEDPRFRDVAPAFRGSLSELFEEALTNPQGARARSIADALPAIRRRVAQIERQRLDVAIRELLRASGISDRHATMIIRRLGWGGYPPASLQEVGDVFGVTRERVRQLVSRTIGRLEPTYMPQIENAVKLLDSQAPISANAASELLVDRGIASVPFRPSAVAAAAETFGYEVTFDLAVEDGIEYVVAPEAPAMTPILTAARRETGRVGISNIDEVHARLENEGETFSIQVIRQLLESSPKIQTLIGDWFWMPGIPPDRNRLRNVTQRMLSVTPRLSVTTARQGIRRRYQFMRIDLVPPSDVLRVFYTAYPEFVVNDDDTVESSEPLDYRIILGDVERVFAEVLRDSPTGLMDRAELEASVTGRGVNPNTFSVFTTYSPIIDHPATNVWCLRGEAVDPAQLEALRAVVATRSRRRRTVADGWDQDGNLWLTVELGNIHAPVIGIPASIARYVASRRFQARTQEGSAAGVVAIDDRGASWGYGPFLRRCGAEPGDALTLRFDLAGEQVTLSLGEEVPLQEGD